ncbi:uncharacterized protein LOC107009770 [Solanum pennellii]|uniref:Uncharacterized protein LOC107009770 n=1 Tax=Solanum pennellii TaxID=28526 RepID=A0ABM1G1H3_SOLPN|nr:uncharacterized protein LOC107009770 [Solanum pennellii]
MVASYKHAIMVKEVTWEKPQQPFLKLNTVGSALNNPGKIGGGGIVRDYQGNMIYAYTIPLGIGTNNQAEIQAVSHGLHWCIQHGYRKIHLEVGSELVIHWLSNQTNYPWNLQPYILEIHRIVHQLERFKITHVYREANNTADRLSKYSHNTDIVQNFYIKDQLPTLAKRKLHSRKTWHG